MDDDGRGGMVSHVTCDVLVGAYTLTNTPHRCHVCNINLIVMYVSAIYTYNTLHMLKHNTRNMGVAICICFSPLLDLSIRTTMSVCLSVCLSDCLK